MSILKEAGEAVHARVRVLTIDPEPAGSERLVALLRDEIEVLSAQNPDEALTLLERNSDIAVIIASHHGSDLDALSFLTTCYHRSPQVRRILITSEDNAKLFRRAVNNAQVHYICGRPLNTVELKPVVSRFAGDFLDEQLSTRLALSATVSNGDRSQDGGMAHKDRLTGLYNHRSFQERFREEVSRARRFSESLSVIFGDIDSFAALNRGAGFRCGDDVLQRVAAILRADDESVRQCDIASRYSGQQFVILLPETGKQGAATKAERLRESVSQAILPGGVSITMSFGIATYPIDAEDASGVLGCAERALQDAKNDGRNQVFIYGQKRGEDWRSLDASTAQAIEFPTFHKRMGDLVHALDRDRTLACIYVDLSRLRRIEQEFGVTQHNRLFARAGELLASMRGDKLRRDDLLCRTDDAEGYLCFVSPPRLGETPPRILTEMISRITNILEDGLAEDMRVLTRDRPQVAAGMGRILANPMIRGERLVHRLVDECKKSAQLEWRRMSQEHKSELQDLVINRRLRTAYQPIVDLQTGTTFAFEALTRGPKDSSLAMPTTLFSVADAVDLTVELDRACFRTALRNAPGCDPSHRLFLNLLPASFYDSNFIEKVVVGMLDDAGLTPANLVFEITERLAIENFAAFRKSLRRYTDMGFGVAVDDVGTRHSNLESVMALQPHYIKLSDILCRGAVSSTVKREMVRSLVRIANTIDAETVAEGIEDKDDLLVLRDLGVRFVQGYYFARPDFCFPELNPEAVNALKRPARLKSNGKPEHIAGDHDATGPRVSTAGNEIPEQNWEPLSPAPEDPAPPLLGELKRVEAPSE